MAVTSQALIELTVELDGTEYNCQVIDAEHIPPAYTGTVASTETACPDGVIADDQRTWTPGSLRGNAFIDTADTGLTWMLRTAQHNQTTIAYKIVHFPELGAAGAVEESGDAVVSTFSYGSFTKPGLGKFPIDLALMTTAGPVRPAAAA